jgi:hypothetical protein
MECGHPNTQWLGVYPTHPVDCIQHIRADARCDGSATFFNHAAGNDYNCACLIPAVDCTDSEPGSASDHKPQSRP